LVFLSTCDGVTFQSANMLQQATHSPTVSVSNLD
jgi:hypothetical protein